MKTTSISEIKDELKHVSQNELIDLCLNLAKYKVENKEFLAYLLFKAHNKTDYVLLIKDEIDEKFNQLKQQPSLYYIKKGLRKLLRLLSKYNKFIRDKAISADLHIYFLRQLNISKIPFRQSQLLINLYEQQLKKINTLVKSLHEDLQQDYYREIETLNI